jgi:hypothetical protein
VVGEEFLPPRIWAQQWPRTSVKEHTSATDLRSRAHTPSPTLKCPAAPRLAPACNRHIPFQGTPALLRSRPSPLPSTQQTDGRLPSPSPPRHQPTTPPVHHHPAEAATMELFPNGGFVRLRSRARDKYVHADADASGVSLRPLGAAPSVNAVWKPEHWPGEEDIFLLQGAAYGRYLAVSDQDAPPGHRGVRAVQRDYNSPHVDAPFMWTAFRVDADQNYVRLHNHQRWLRANGRHRYWNNVVTVDTRNGSLTTMMQWRVEAIPVSPQPLPLLPPPQQPTVSSPSFLLSTPHVYPVNGLLGCWNLHIFQAWMFLLRVEIISTTYA